ncbi:MAG: pantetheine-phosphate adenylyltransferase [Acidobacteria bacterium]|nr:pantetheine-phosphate adenylyltransferase [Acidobacteriota bacterium]
MTSRTLRAIYPGSFDPVTNGHLDLARRAAQVFGSLVVAVLRNTDKAPLFDAEERREMFAEALAEHGIADVRVVAFEGLLADFARAEGATIVVRGLRAISDFEFELQMALMNRRLQKGLESVFLTPGEDVSFISSRLVREIARLGGDVSGLVPTSALRRLERRFGPAVAGRHP